ncbi:hypothetical protein ABTH94_22065, partial [Acinetobacter baumannii]
MDSIFVQTNTADPGTPSQDPRETFAMPNRIGLVAQPNAAGSTIDDWVQSIADATIDPLPIPRH